MCKTNEKKQTCSQLKEAWDRAREMIKHENELINQRLSWMFAAQAFLFAAFLIGVKAAVDPDIEDTLDRVLMVFFLLPVIYLGLFSSLTSYRMVRDANIQREFAESYWKRLSRKILKLPELPRATELQKDSMDDKFVQEIFSFGFPERIQGENLTTECFGLFSKIPGAKFLTRDHTFPKVFSYTWVVMLILWLVLILKLLYVVVINRCLFLISSLI
ncbi:MAG: hypothetical protein FVQ85_14045 [Planctomycetes bacterium]|nr:hypothetical protein [Planctomycetota bacterium]